MKIVPYGGFVFLLVFILSIVWVSDLFLKNQLFAYTNMSEMPHSKAGRVKPLPPDGDLRPSSKDGLAQKSGTVEKNLPYCQVDGTALQMDVYYPSSLRESSPAVVYLHGGGWTSGDKREAGRIWSFLQNHPDGDVLVSVNYRLAPAHRFPAQIEDVKCAIRHLRANAARYHIDPDRLGVIGVSAGGHLAALLGLAGENTGWEVGDYLEQSSRVNAVVVMAAPVDFSRDFPVGSRSVVLNVFGISDRDDPMLSRASPATYASPGDPPFLILHGEKDSLVPVEQAKTFYEKLISAGVPAELVLIKNAAHSLNPVGGKMAPGILELAQKITAFFHENLAGKNGGSGF